MNAHRQNSHGITQPIQPRTPARAPHRRRRDVGHRRDRRRCDGRRHRRRRGDAATIASRSSSSTISAKARPAAARSSSTAAFAILQQGNVSLVREALHERGRLIKNAPHLVHPLPTIVPLHSRWEGFYYGIGLKVYDLLSGRLRLGPSRHLSLAQTLAEIPTLETHGHLRRRALSRRSVRRRTVAGEPGADGDRRGGGLRQLRAGPRVDQGSGPSHGRRRRGCGNRAGELRVKARVVVNATGPFSDRMRQLDDPQAAAAIVPSQGIHLVFDRAFMPGDTALIVPKTPRRPRDLCDSLARARDGRHDRHAAR